VVVDYLDLLRLAVLPDEADPKLVVDPDAVLALPIAGQSLEAIAWERAEVVEALGGVQLRQLPLRNPSNGPKTPRRVPLEQALGVSVPEGPDHLLRVLWAP
jgi:hypothetical protein